MRPATEAGDTDTRFLLDITRAEAAAFVAEDRSRGKSDVGEAAPPPNARQLHDDDCLRCTARLNAALAPGCAGGQNFKTFIKTIGVEDELPVDYRGGVGKSNRGGLGGRGWELEKLRSNENL